MNSAIIAGQKEQSELNYGGVDMRLKEFISVPTKDNQKVTVKNARKVCRARPEAERGVDLDVLSRIERHTSRPYTFERHMTVDAFKSLNFATVSGRRVVVDGCTWGSEYFQTTVVQTAAERCLCLTLHFSEKTPIYNVAIKEVVGRRRTCSENMRVYGRRGNEIVFEVKSYYQRGGVVMEKVQRELDAIYKAAKHLLLLELAK